ncbi:MAG TPA: hypothetical protein VD978_34755 [Azospirillum sp.]|nr:hypothetical protein [Azospirillum sp.]
MARPLPSSASLDDRTAQAVEVLALAVQRERIPGIIEFGVASDALERAAASRRRADLESAAVAFDSLDAGFRARIVERAYDLARSERGRLRMPQLPPPAARTAAELPTAFAEATTQGAGRARTRLMADLGRRSAARDDARATDLAPTLDEIIPIQPRRPEGPPPKWWE